MVTTMPMKRLRDLRRVFRAPRRGALVVLLLLAGIWAVPRSCAAQGTDGFAQNQRLGRGVNILGYDPIWRSPDQARFQVKHFRLLHEAGFDSVRINLQPFRYTSREQNWKLPDGWFATLDWAVTNALGNGLTVILDLHEFTTMAEDPAGRHDQFLAIWRQVAEHYQSATNRVLFEILNEPSGQLTPELWNRYLREALTLIRESNPARTVIVGPPFWNSIDHLQDLMLPPDDRNLIVTVHYYAPMEFTHQGAPWSSQKDKSNVIWSGSTEERKAIRDAFATAADWAREQDRPIFLGEFGAYDKAPMESRVRYVEAVARTAETFGWSWAYWQFDSDFILYDIDADTWVQPIRDALIPQGEMEVRQARYDGKPFRGRAQSLPGALECELYDEGGEGVAYHETDGRNHGSGELNKKGNDLDNFRKDEDVDLSYTKDGWDNSEFNRVPQQLERLYLGWTAPGEWARYTVDIAQSGRYSLGVMYTARYDGGVLLECDERATGGPIRLTSTADVRDERRNWHHWNYHELKDAVFLHSGRHVLTIKVLEPGNLNLDRIDFAPAQSAEPPPLK
jgi:endoglucanase